MAHGHYGENRIDEPEIWNAAAAFPWKSVVRECPRSHSVSVFADGLG
jgi:hypothetical protein